MTTLYTAQFRYRYCPERIDITVKSKDPLWGVFAPSWEMVMGYKNGTMSADEYTQRYIEIVERIIQTNPNGVLDKLSKMQEAIFVCFCRSGDFCHRLILARHLSQRFPAYFQYGGEIPA